ncbi:hypothetical protein BGZ94_009656 [Podila epigama]|nr:hypothetical protein BGZ94_009656 [Podila epigama]
MFIKSLAVATVAVVATVSAQIPKHTYFTGPLGEGVEYPANKPATFSWTGTCAPPSDAVIPPPANASAVNVQLVDSTNATNVVFLDEVAVIDCTKSNGNTVWTVPDKFPNVKVFALRIMFEPPQYSGNFKILQANSPKPDTPAPAPGNGGDDKKSAGSILTPVLSGVAAVVASAAMMYL